MLSLAPSPEASWIWRKAAWESPSMLKPPGFPTATEQPWASQSVDRGLAGCPGGRASPGRVGTLALEGATSQEALGASGLLQATSVSMFYLEVFPHPPHAYENSSAWAGTQGWRKGHRTVHQNTAAALISAQPRF